MGYCMKWLPLAVKGVDREKRTMDGMASTSAVDYEGEVILPSAWKESLRAWKRLGSRPKFIAAHRHALDDGHSPVLGLIESMETTEDGLAFKSLFAGTALGQEYLELYAMGAMDAFSVGFVPQEREFDPDKIAKLLEKNGIDTKGATVRCVTTKAHVLEVSAVVIGMNATALVKRSGEEIPGKAIKELADMGFVIGADNIVAGQKCGGGLGCEACAAKRLEESLRALPAETEIATVGVDTAAVVIEAPGAPENDGKPAGGGWDETDDMIRHRLRDPGDFKDGTFRTVTLKKDKPRIMSVMGKLKDGEGGMVKQNLMFPKDDGWDMGKAKAYCREHPDMEKMFDGIEIEEKASELTTQVKALTDSQIEIKAALARIEASLTVAHREEPRPERRAASTPARREVSEADILMAGLRETAESIHAAAKAAAKAGAR